MSREVAAAVILVTGSLCATTLVAQQRPYNLIMKDIQTSFTSLKKNLDASGVTAAPAGAPGAGRGGAPAAEGGRGAGRGRGAAAPANWDPAIRDAAVEDATKLQALMKETEGFWEKFNTHDAMDQAKAAQTATADVVSATMANDPGKAQAAYAGIQRTCGACHGIHREDTGKGFAIKP